MKKLFTISLAFFWTLGLWAQENQIKELVSQGIELHDQGKYDEAIAKYKAALAIDKNSSEANYELSYTYLETQHYEEGIKHSKLVIEQNSDNQHGAYIILGSCLDLAGKPEKAIKIYKEGLEKFPNSNLLNYNLALTSYNQKDYDGAEKAAINAIIAKPTHGSSHIILAATMKAKGQRVKALLSTYYFLMLEPNSKRSKNNYNSLRTLLGQGVEKKDEKSINVNVPLNPSNDNEFDAAEMMVSMLAASQFTEENKNKSELELFAETTNKFFSVLGELKNEKTGFWWDFYVTKLYDLVQTNNDTAFSYHISQSNDSEIVTKWMTDNANKMQSFSNWMSKKQ